MYNRINYCKKTVTPDPRIPKYVIDELFIHIPIYLFCGESFLMCSDPYRMYPEIFLTMEIPPEDFLKD
jgi:hypothetical protein